MRAIIASTTTSLSPIPAPAIDAATYIPSAATAMAPMKSLTAAASSVMALASASILERKRHATEKRRRVRTMSSGKNHLWGGGRDRVSLWGGGDGGLERET